MKPDIYNAIKYQARSNCELRQRSCVDCKADWQKVVRIKDHETNLGEFDVYFCRTCNLGFTDPHPTEETSGYLYEAKENSDFDIIRHSFIDKIKDFLGFRLIARLAPHKNIRAVLDYGTGNGRFAMSAAKVFPSARVDAVDYQVDPPQLLQIAATSSNQVNYCDAATFAEQHVNTKYDIIILRHVLEHTYHPVNLIKYLSERLDADGVIYVEVPNLDSGCAKIFGKYWKGYYVPRHIYHYTINSLKEIANLCELEVEIGRNEMPLMGNTISILTGADKSNTFVQGLGILLHPVQLAIEALYRSSTCINARYRRLKYKG
ncbi:MAG: methyltransferase [Anaerolineaceae bacterium]|nr:MAG: methyltransferase [Anaerolineaceae bacterium]